MLIVSVYRHVYNKAYLKTKISWSCVADVRALIRGYVILLKTSLYGWAKCPLQAMAARRWIQTNCSAICWSKSAIFLSSIVTRPSFARWTDVARGKRFIRRGRRVCLYWWCYIIRSLHHTTFCLAEPRLTIKLQLIRLLKVCALNGELWVAMTSK